MPSDEESDATASSSTTNIKFTSPSDKVVSEVNPFLVASKDSNIQPRQKPSNLIATITFSASQRQQASFRKKAVPSSSRGREEPGLVLDADGDLDLPRGPQNDEDEFNIFIEYENSTTIDLVGLQIWRGAFLLSDFVIHNFQEYFLGKKVLELGAGTGLVGIVAGMFSERVTLTDLQEPSIMNLLKANLSHNKHLVDSGNLEVLPLDFMNLQWSPELVQKASEADVVVAADVIYHVVITTAFVRTLKKLMFSGNKTKDFFIALEKRYIFTLADMDAVAPMHNHFLEELDNQFNICPGSLQRTIVDDASHLSVNISVQSLPTAHFQQYFNYERCKELVLYHIRTVPSN